MKRQKDEMEDPQVQDELYDWHKMNDAKQLEAQLKRESEEQNG